MAPLIRGEPSPHPWPLLSVGNTSPHPWPLLSVGKCLSPSVAPPIRGETPLPIRGPSYPWGTLSPIRGPSYPWGTPLPIRGPSYPWEKQGRETSWEQITKFVPADYPFGIIYWNDWTAIAGSRFFVKFAGHGESAIIMQT